MRFLPAFIAVALLVTFAAGCNIFGFVSDNEKTPMEKAEEAIRKGDYARAKQELTDENGALKDSTDSMILYTYSKAALLESGLTIPKIMDLVRGDGSKTDNGNLAFLEEIDKQSDETKTAWYRANVEMSQNLNRIWNGDASGQMTRDDITLDYSIACIMGGIMSLRDTNRDNIIDERDLRFNVIDVGQLFGSGNTVFSFDEIIGVDSQGNATAYKGLTAFLGDPVLGRTAKPAGIPGYAPDDINLIIGAFLEFLYQGEESIRLCIDNSDQNTTYDPEQILEYIYQVARIINCFWYNDGVDNDGDGRIDEEIINGIDDDGDGLIDEDSGYMAAYDSTNTVNTQYVPLWEKWKSRF